jgi:glycosyltransferase involved in cell wall biosynthesis
MKLSVICPTYNEIFFIDKLIDQLCYDDGLEKEILVTDGGSTDGTRERITSLMSKYSNLKLIDNPGRTSTKAFNTAFKLSTGKYIAFVGAHAEYNKSYFTSGINCLDKDECDVAGGPLNQDGKSAKGKAIALVMSSKLGVGNTEFRTESKKMYVESVAFAIYKREVVEQCGLMDETLPVNQDDEFHYRIRKMGKRILMIPEMSATYFVRNSYSKLYSQYFRYGLYKPAVLKKVSGAMRLRHVIPALFATYVITLPLSFFYLLWLIPFGLYLLLIIFRSLSFDVDWKIRLLSMPVFPIIHFSYGIGFLSGIFRRT